MRIRLVVALFVMFAGGASAEETLVVVLEERPPYRIPDESSPSGFSGIDLDLLEAIADALAIPVVVERHPFARSLEMMRTGAADVMTGLAYSVARAAFIAYVPTPYAEVRPVFYTVCGRADRIRSYGDLSGLTVGYLRDFVYFEPFDSDRTLTKVGVTAERQRLEMLVLGRLDVIVGTEPTMSWNVRTLGFADVVEPTAYAPNATTPLYVGLSRRSAARELVDRVDEAVRALVASGEMARIVERYR